MSITRKTVLAATSLSTVALVTLLVSSMVPAYADITISGSGSGALTALPTIPLAAPASPLLMDLSPDGSKLYVSNGSNGTLSIITTATGTATTVPLSGSTPYAVDVSPDGAFVYVTLFGASKVDKISTTSPFAVTPLTTAKPQPHDVAVSNDSTRLYVADSGGDVEVLDAAGAHVTSIATGASHPVGIALNPAGTRAYVTSIGDNVVVVIDTTTNQVVTTITGLGSYPIGEQVSPDGSKLYVAEQLSNKVEIIDTTTNTLLSTSYPVGNHPYDLALSPDGESIYVPAQNDDAMSIIDLRKNPVTATSIATGTSPVGVVVSPDGTHLYVANNASATISVFSAERLNLTGPGSAAAGSATATFAVALTDGMTPHGDFTSGTVRVELLNSASAVVATSAATQPPGPGPFSVTVPTLSLPAGTYTARATYLNANNAPTIIALATGFELTPELAATGTEATSLVLFAIVLSMLGGTALVVSRRRRPHNQP